MASWVQRDILQYSGWPQGLYVYLSMAWDCGVTGKFFFLSSLRGLGIEKLTKLLVLLMMCVLCVIETVALVVDDDDGTPLASLRY